jgi:hypothetical protein
MHSNHFGKSGKKRKGIAFFVKCEDVPLVVKYKYGLVRKKHHPNHCKIILKFSCYLKKVIIQSLITNKMEGF